MGKDNTRSKYTWQTPFYPIGPNSKYVTIKSYENHKILCSYILTVSRINFKWHFSNTISIKQLNSKMDVNDTVM